MSKRSVMSIAGLLVIVGAILARDESRDTRRGAEAVGTAVTPTLEQRVIERKGVLDRHELKRAQTLDLLEFGPLPPRPIRPISFPRLCFLPSQTAATAIDPHRSLFVHDRATLDATSATFTANLSLNRTLSQIASEVSVTVPGTNAVSIFRQFWDTQNPAAGVTTGPHCDDNSGTIINFPITCPRLEGSLAMGIDLQVEANIEPIKA